MRTSSVFVLVVASSARLAAAHATVWNILVNGVDKCIGRNQGGYIDSPPTNDPMLDVTSSNMECNVPGIKATSSITVSGGDEIAVCSIPIPRQFKAETDLLSLFSSSGTTIPTYPVTKSLPNHT